MQPADLTPVSLNKPGPARDRKLKPPAHWTRVLLVFAAAACSSEGDAGPPRTQTPATTAAGSSSAAPAGTLITPSVAGNAATPAPAAPPAAAAPSTMPPAVPMTTPGPRPAAPGGAPTKPAAPPAEPVLVDAADEAACDPIGTPPDASEPVEVLKIRISDVAPGWKAAGGTTYACFWVDIDMPEKHHIIGWEGAVGGDRSVHHQQVSLAAKPFYLTQQGGLCGLPTVDYTWTGEKPTEWTPKLAGYPVGGPENGGKAHFLWQTHIEGASSYAGGFNVYVTKKLRKYDAGNFEQGDVRGISIPPMAQNHVHTAKCSADMLRPKLVQPIYVFASMQHAHLMIRNIKSDLWRDGAVAKNFGDQKASGFAGFFDQQFKPQRPCVKIMPGDELTTVCTYQNPTNLTITGGEATNQEMCTTFYQYFPRLPGTSNNFCGTIDSSGGFNPGMP